MEFQLSAALGQWQLHVRRFVQHELQPHDQEIEHSGRIPSAVLERMRQAGLFGINTPASYGGLGHGMLGTCLAIEELAKAHIVYYYT
jgi:acyl-CoA dehydrogenase